MSPAASESLRAAYRDALLELAAIDPKVVVLESGPPDALLGDSFRTRYPDRYLSVASADRTTWSRAADIARDGHTVFVHGPARALIGESYPTLRDTICRDGANVKLICIDAGLSSSDGSGTTPFVEDLGIVRGLPAMTVVAPADAPSTGAAVGALHAGAGPAYLRLSPDERPPVTDGTFRIGRAAELREGSDLTIVALGPMVAPGLEVAEELARVGVSTRVLDFASVKPFDEPALLRAARDTGAILALEDHSVLTGLGALVAATTSENHPIPVRRVGVPDVFVRGNDWGSRFERYGLGVSRIRDEAWELLRLRGKVQ